MIEFVHLNDEGRHFREEYRVRMDDTHANGLLRLDGIARYLQDVATDDSHDSVVASADPWVVRRTALRLVKGATWPHYLDLITLTTWCGGTGPAWAERRTNIELEGRLVIETSAIWVPVDAAGRPVRLRENFFEVYGEGARERKVSGRLTKAPIPSSAQYRPWPLRTADLDVMGHVNNAALWQALSEVLASPVHFVNVQHHASVEGDDVVTLVTSPGHLWLTVGDDVRVSAQYELL
ncbi:MAG TPA: acyl-ACP thioesterase domain-containing protein [Acidimicrobiales bacterium]